jgi:hypothetical protein
MYRSRRAGSAGRSDNLPGRLVKGRFARARAIPLILAIAGLSTLGLSPSSGPSASPAPSASPTISSSSSAAASGPLASAGAASHAPVLAYYYMWFNAASWTHTKTDVPVLGSYASTSPAVIKQHVFWAKEAGVDAFIVSWKSTPALNLALSELVAECRSQGLKLVLIYEGLDVNRNPIPTAQVQSDLLWFENQYGSDPVFNVFGKPAVIWSGTWRFSSADISQVRTQLGAPNQILLLGSERSAADYRPRASLFDGDAYYWSSGDPVTTPGYQKRLTDLAAAVHSGNGLWLAPAAAGFDARLNGGATVVDRRNGATLTAAWDDALVSNADAIAVISWNEFTENSYVEPSHNYGERYLQVLALLTGAAGPVVHAATATPGANAPPSPSAKPSSTDTTAVPLAAGRSAPGRGSTSDLLASLLVAAVVLGALGVLSFSVRNRLRHAPDRPEMSDRGNPTGRTDSLGRPIR